MSWPDPDVGALREQCLAEFFAGLGETMSYAVNRGAAVVFEGSSGVALSTRLRRLEIMSDCLIPFFQQNQRAAVVVKHGLPDDTALVRAFYEPYRDVLTLILCSESFSEVPEGDPVPSLDQEPVFTRVPYEIEPLLPK